jgi:uncharacterized membrane protein SpoIIM required for sporulation
VKPQDDFVRARRSDWDELDALLARAPALHRLPPEAISRAATLYRSVCSDLMRARVAGYHPDLLALLDALTARAHNALYSAPPYRLAGLWELLCQDFPRTLRAHARFFALAAALFVLPGLLGFVGAHRSRAFALALLSPEAAQQLEEAYAEGFGQGRGAGQDVAMAGFYVYNNVGIAFRCFATGVLFGLGSLFFLVYNGLVIGAVAGLVTAGGHGRNLLIFVCGHAPFELTAILIAGTAGMVMGYALVDTGGRPRFASLRARAPDLARLVLGAAAMLLVAALIEGFWSPSAVAAPIKLAVAVAGAVSMALYLWRAGRPGRHP